jgi:hypothetical protein
VGLVVSALLILVFTALVAVLDLHTAWLLAPAVLVLVLVTAIAIAVNRINPAVRFTDEGYVVRGFRGAGVKAARWKDVEDAVTTFRGDLPCVSIRLKNGSSTTIPVTVLACDRESFVRDLTEHLQSGQGYRAL